MHIGHLYLLYVTSLFTISFRFDKLYPVVKSNFKIAIIMYNNFGDFAYILDYNTTTLTIRIIIW